MKLARIFGLTLPLIHSAHSISMPKMTLRFIRLTGVVLILGALIAGCGSDAQQVHKDVRAKLDPQSGQIILPLESYAMTQAELQDVSHANALLIDECLGQQGRDFPRAAQDWDAIPVLPDRRYGVWTSSDAKTNGYELPAAPGAAELNAQEDALSESWWTAYQSCESKVQVLPQMGANSSSKKSSVDQGMRESFDALKASSEFASILKEWTGCITSKGLTPNTAENYLVPSFPPAGEEQLRVAGIDVECKESLNIVQPLADFEARQQMAYIDQHESELTEYRAQVEKVIASAREVLATRGS